MAAGGDDHFDSFVTERIIPLEDTTNIVSFVICRDKIISIDNESPKTHNKVKINRLSDGTFLAVLDSQSHLTAICLMDDNTICVLHFDGLIEMASIESEKEYCNLGEGSHTESGQQGHSGSESSDITMFTITQHFHLRVGFDIYSSVASVNGNIVVVGLKHNIMYWCIVSLDNGNVDCVHRICRVQNGSISCYMTTNDNMIYISCLAGTSYEHTGLYGFDISNPRVRHEYHNNRLQFPKSVVSNENGDIFVCNFGSIIHQLTADCERRVTYFRETGVSYCQGMYWYNGRLYVTCWMSPNITVFRH
ncbi:hypothetical protein ACJMK2_015181 [Sinanodonta woodiana]|uniref:Uncharacterized protein n=1 Tax=Sinanodonta woodiana TaxID=1069815 RepID=A0ABD3V2V4_SINWO